MPIVTLNSTHRIRTKTWSFCDISSVIELKSIAHNCILQLIIITKREKKKTDKQVWHKKTQKIESEKKHHEMWFKLTFSRITKTYSLRYISTHQAKIIAGESSLAGVLLLNSAKNDGCINAFRFQYMVWMWTVTTHINFAVCQIYFCNDVVSNIENVVYQMWERERERVDYKLFLTISSNWKFFLFILHIFI